MRQNKKITALKVTGELLKWGTVVFTMLLTGQIFCFFYWQFYKVSLIWWKVALVQLICYPVFLISTGVWLSIADKIERRDRPSD